MTLSGPIIIVEDDIDDQEILTEVFREINGEVKLLFFDKTQKAFDYLKAAGEQPFLIMSDVNLPGENGIEFKRRIDNDTQLRQKSIPFVFFSTTVDKQNVDLAYEELTVQGFFKKSTNYAQLKRVVHVIMEYWTECRHPNVPVEKW
jgi:CheY-like chemotaxis protein